MLYLAYLKGGTKYLYLGNFGDPTQVHLHDRHCTDLREKSGITEFRRLVTRSPKFSSVDAELL